MEEEKNKSEEKFVPQEFWFNRPSGTEEFTKQRDKLCFSFLIKSGEVECLEDIDKLYEIKDKMLDLQHDYMYKSGIHFLGAPNQIINDFNEKIQELEKKFGCTYNDNIVEMEKTEIVNGYHLFNVREVNIFLRNRYNELLELYNDTSMTDEEFKIWFKRNACTEWCKMQPNGEYFGGYYDTDRENAFDLTHKKNLDSLLKLPYSRKLMCETIDIGCGNLNESVRYTNFLCEWIKRKKEQINN